MKKLFYLQNKAPKDLKGNGSKWQLPLLIFLLLLLPVMAGIQHHYLGELSKAEKVRLKTNLELMAKNFSKDFNNELGTIQQTFRFNQESSAGFESRLNHAYLTWKQAAPYPDLIKDIYLLEFQKEKPILNIFNIQKGIFSPGNWSAELDVVKRHLPATSEESPNMLLFLQETPILIKYTIIISPCIDCQISENETNSFPIIPLNFIIIVLNPDAVNNNLLPGLIKKHFPVQKDFQLDIAIARGDMSDDVFYISNPDLNITDFHNAEVQTEIGQWDQQNKDLLRVGAVKSFILPPTQNAAGKPILSDNKEMPRSFSIITPGKIAPQPEKWELLIKLRNDTFEGIVDKTRKRNLLTSYFILAILGISMVMVYVSTRRANSLARRQLRFVSGVSHELRTPISVIRSAGENLADGLVADMNQQKQYGRLIRDEGRRLSSMVENILSFSALQNGKTTLNLKAARIIDILEECINSRSGSKDLPGPNIKIESDSNVPLVKVDYDSIKIAFNNVIDNCIKYSPDDSPILIRIRHASPDNQLIISFEDHGRGIDDEDLPYIFDPFFRGKNTEDQRTPGSGIGLSLVNDIIIKHGGKVEVKSKRHKGTVVSVILPVNLETTEV